MMLKKEFELVFSPKKIGSVSIPNRLVRSATYECRAMPSGEVTDSLIRFYEELGQGGSGLVITGMTYVREDGRPTPKMVANDSDDKIYGLSRITGAFHDATKELGYNSKIFLQIGHCGREAGPHGWDGPLISSSAIEDKVIKRIPKELTITEINNISRLFAEATLRAKKAGFDGVQYHGAHGYLITQFYSPYMNKRNDKFGGSTENRAKFSLQIIKNSRALVGNSYPICMKMNGSDRISSGLQVNEASKLAKIFEKAGYDSLEISSYIWEAGMLENVISLPPEARRNVRKRNIEAYNLDLAIQIKNELKIPVMVVGGIYRFENVSNILLTTNIDFCAFSRPLIAQPNLPRIWMDWKKGSPYPEAECIHCNLCTRDFLIKGNNCPGIRCIKKERSEQKK
ncbi:MAG: NADH:flavin oxidoreductase [Candidatus Lokiarchaeota archaeon]|nr:NADH:flavin oxidoreductase [Candidatus Lokiarchaeota archaeon]